MSTPHIPASVAETLRRRLARLSTPCVRLLEWAAVAGRDIDTTLLVRCGAATAEVRGARSAGRGPPCRCHRRSPRRSEASPTTSTGKPSSTA